jgi:biopolymer transport protein ExbB
MSAFQFIAQGDAISKFVALLLLAMSVASWVVIVWKAWMIKRAVPDVARSIAAFWQAPDLAQAQSTVASLDREGLVLPLIEASHVRATGTLATVGDKAQQLTRVLRFVAYSG